MGLIALCAIPHFLELCTFSPNVFIHSLVINCLHSIKGVCCFGFQHEILLGPPKKSIDKMKTNSYHFGNARFSHIKFAKIKSDSVFLLGLENGPILYTC